MRIYNQNSTWQLLSAILVTLALQSPTQAAPQGWKDFLRELGNTAKEINETKDANKKPENDASEEEQLSTKEIYDELLKSTVWIRTTKGSGTGWIYDKKEGLVVTNHHVVAGVEYASVFAPKFKDGELITDEIEYESYTRPISGFVADSEIRTDLAVIKVDPTSLPKYLQPIKIAAKSASAAERVHVIGGLPKQSQGMFVYANGYVRQVSKGNAAMPGEVWLIQSTVPTNPGNSGGAIVNDRAELVGVHSTRYHGVQNVTGGTDVREVKQYLETFNKLYPPQSANDWFDIGFRHYIANRAESATRHFTSALKFSPEMSAAYRMRGYAYNLKNDHELAMADFESAIKLNPSDAAAFHGRGLVYKSNGELQKAEKDLTEAIRLDPTIDLAHYDRGTIHYSLRKYQKAIKDYTRTIEINPYNSDALISRGLVFLDQNQLKNAMQDFEASVAIRPTSVAYNNIGVTFLRMKDNASAIASFNKATKYDPKNYLAWENLGEVLYLENRYEESISHAAYALKLNPKSARAVYIQAQSELVGGNKHHALSDVNKGIRMYPNYSYYYELRSRIHQELGNSKKAEEDLQMAVKLNPQSVRTAVAKAVVPTLENLQGSWRVQATVRGVKFNSIIRFDGYNYSFTSNWIDIHGTQGQTKGNGTFTTRNGTLTLRDSYGQVTNHSIGFVNGQLSMQFPGMNSTENVMLYRSSKKR